MKHAHSSRRFLFLGVLLVVAIGFLVIRIAQTTNQPFVDNEFISDITNTVESTPEPTNDVVPAFLKRSFPDTDFSNAHEDIQKVLRGGPPKDGIPAIDDPKFVPISEVDRPETIQAIVMEDGDTIKVYPYNILTWHEIVNDTVAGVPVAITFCPLCGSAIVYERTLPDGTVTTFGVSGTLIESNMVMYDRATESLWQQSTGEALAGQHVGTVLELAPFQLLTLGDVREKHPEALVLSESTGYQRDYSRNPYSGYAEDDGDFIFAPSELDERFPAKEIMAVFRVDDTYVATPWLTFENDTEKTAVVNEKEITLEKNDDELTILDDVGNEIPFYFEMWFSFAVQHGTAGVVIE